MHILNRFKVPKDVRLCYTHFFIMKIPNKRELQQIALNEGQGKKQVALKDSKPKEQTKQIERIFLESYESVEIKNEINK